MELWEILVPCMMNGHYTRTAHHKEWDKVVRGITGGLTIMLPAKGHWVDSETGLTNEERMIPVRIACNREQIEKIIDFSIEHYKQIAIMAYKISEDVIIKRKDIVEIMEKTGEDNKELFKKLSK